MKLFLLSRKKPPLSELQLRRLVSIVLKGVQGAAFEKRSEVSLVFTGDAEVRKLNRLYRKKDKTTDVLSFPLLEGKKLGNSKRGPIALGDVVLSLPQARRQAAKLGRSFREETALLLAHGLLHLLGYDHATLPQEKRMFALQDKFLRKFGG